MALTYTKSTPQIILEMDKIEILDRQE